MIQNVIYGTGGDSSFMFKPSTHVRESNNETIVRDLSMYNIEMVQPWADATDANQVTSIYKSQIDKLPLWNDCCIYDTDSPYYQSGDWTTADDYRILHYRFNKYGINAHYLPFVVVSGNSPMYILDGLHYSNYRIWSSPFYVGSSGSSMVYWENLKPCFVYLAKSSTTNGFWLVHPSYTSYGVSKAFITTCIDENDGSIGYKPVVATTGNVGVSTNVCYIYPSNGYRVDMGTWSVMRSGYSGSYVIKQVRILNYLFPDLYVISGGLSKINQDIIHIDNNTYIHLYNDIFIKIK